MCPDNLYVNNGENASLLTTFLCTRFTVHSVAVLIIIILDLSLISINLLLLEDGDIGLL